MSLLIVGCGYVGEALVRWLRNEPARSTQSAFVLTRSEERMSELRKLGVQPLLGHWLIPESLPEAPEVTRVLITVPHRADTVSGLSEDSDQAHVVGLQNVRNWLSRSNQPLSKTRLIYLSTTGVFGASESGQTVTERTDVSPTRIGPRIAVAAERWIEQNRPVWPTVVLRLAGIYGPGRVPLVHSLRAGQPLAVPRSGFLNLIHVDDIARAIGWSMDAENPKPLYLLSDGQPVEREIFYRYLADLCGVSEPQFVEPDDSSKSRRATDKRIDSTLFWQDSGLQPKYSDYRSGLRSAVVLE